MTQDCLSFRTNAAPFGELRRHLRAGSDDFDPPLRQRVDLDAYARKIERFAVRFEAWYGARIIGLLAAYFNDPGGQTGFITHVNVSPGFQDKGIASKLMETCIDYGQERGFREILLEVDRENAGALFLYEKFDFKITEEKTETFRMKRTLSNP